MTRLLDAYRAFHEQAFTPIFINDGFDSRMLLDACVMAGIKGIEYTLRRRDADKMIPWIRANYPDLYILVGSTMDDDMIVANARRKHPQLLTVAKLDAMGVDGFVSMLGWSPESIKRYSPNRIIMPSAMTVNEAFFQIRAGAHFIKLLGPEIDLIRKCRGEPTFGYCPIMVTGGMTLERIPDAIGAGAMILGSGFDLILRGQPEDITSRQAADILRRFVDVTGEARAKQWPEMSNVTGAETQRWLDSLPHYHPF